jgi:hypothetical protein
MTRILILILLLASGSLNAQEAKYHTTFQLTKFYVDSAEIHWTTIEESGPLPFQIEQYLCGKWTKVAEVMGNGSADTNTYAMKVFFHNGENLFRIVQWGIESGPRLSRPAAFNAFLPEVKYAMEKEKIVFSENTFYQLIKEETIIKTGYGKSIDISYLNKGEYKLCFDTKMEILKL